MSSRSLRWAFGGAVVAAILVRVGHASAGNPLGAACTTAPECTSGFCTDGVCCEAATCGTGLTCSPVPSCSIGGATAGNPEPGRCRMLLGTRCDASNAARCSGGASHCVDGVCCLQDASGCGPAWGTCVVCNAPTTNGCLGSHGVTSGVCGVASAGPPPAGRSCAVPAGSDAACAGHFACSGSSGACAIVANTECKPASCEGSTGTRASMCDASGKCVTPAATKCEPYACNPAGECLKSCSSGTDCAGGYTCASGTCVAQTGGTCSADLTTSTAKDGTSTACGAYKCEPTSGACRLLCNGSDDCAAGGNCNLTSRQCEGSSTPADAGGCATSEGAGGSATGVLLAVAFAAAARRRSTRPKG